MHSEETASISAKTWARSVEPINKTGYKDGASDGQTATFQSSFNTGYSQGLSFGLLLGFNEAVLRCCPSAVDHLDSIVGVPLLSYDKNEKSCNLKNTLTDPRRINCQLCINRNIEEKIDNLFNSQEEKNKTYLLKIL